MKKYLLLSLLIRIFVAHAADHSVDNPIALALECENEECYRDALFYYSEAVSENLHAIYKAGDMCVKIGWHEKAIAYFERAAALGHPDAFIQLGYLAENQGKHAEAINHYFNAIRLGSINGLWQMGRFYHNYGQMDAARPYFLSAAQMGHLKAMNHLGFGSAGNPAPRPSSFSETDIVLMQQGIDPHDIELMQRVAEQDAQDELMSRQEIIYVDETAEIIAEYNR